MSPKVFLTGGDGIGWALDEDIRLVREALAEIVEFTDLDSCEVIHSVWWTSLLAIPDEKLVGKRIICHIPGAPERVLSIPEHRRVMPLVGCWSTHSRRAMRALAAFGIPNMVIPHTIDMDTFRPLDRNSDTLREATRRWALPDDRFLIGNFHRDTEGNDFRTPKLDKGPDVFAEIVRILWSQGAPIHVVLAGPRRHWMRKRLAGWGVPFSYLGREVKGEDIELNTLSREHLNVLYNLIDLYVISSRSEGGPQSVMEAASARCKVIGSDVGMVADVLAPKCVFTDPLQAVDMIVRDIGDGWLARLLERNQLTVREGFTPTAVAPLFRDLYRSLNSIAPYRGGARPRRHRGRRRIHRLIARYRSRPLRVGLRSIDGRGKYGSYETALVTGLRRRGVRIVEGKDDARVDVRLLGGVDTADTERIRENCPFVWRCVSAPAVGAGQMASAATIVPTGWLLSRLVTAGTIVMAPVIIHEGPDPSLFARVPDEDVPPEDLRVLIEPGAWCGDPSVAAADILSDGLDRTPIAITQQWPDDTVERAHVLRTHHVLVAGSDDPRAAAALEAQACGIPVLYRRDSSAAEVVRFGGLAYGDAGELRHQLDVLVANIPTFRRLSVAPHLDATIDRYLAVLRDVADR